MSNKIPLVIQNINGKNVALPVVPDVKSETLEIGRSGYVITVELKQETLDQIDRIQDPEMIWNVMH